MSLLLQSPKRWLANSSSMVENKVYKRKLTLTQNDHTIKLILMTKQEH